MRSRSIRVGRLLALTPLLLAGACDRPDEPAALPAGGAPAPLVAAGTRVDVPASVPIALDGDVVPAEWEAAVSLPLGADGARLLVEQHRGTLLFAFDLRRPWPRDGRLVLVLTPDVEGAGAASPGAVRIDYEPTEHDRPHALVTRRDAAAESVVLGEVVARARTRGARATGEVAVRSSLLGSTGEVTGTFRFAALLVREAGERPLTWPEGLDFVSGRTPRDYLDGARWGRLSGIATGPGAHSATDWKRWTDEDAEMQRRGDAAHALALLVDEEPDLAKRDVEMVPDLVENLRWIAAREPLAPRDLYALASGYRFLNRADEAIAVLDALAMDPVWGRMDSVLHLRARALVSRERWDEAALAWTAARDAALPTAKAHYEALAHRATERRPGWEAEQRARAEDLARADLPMVLLRTNRGNVVVQVLSADVPKAGKHFLDLAQRRGEDGTRFYDGTLFHRVLGDRLVHGGDPTTRGGACDPGGRDEGPERVEVERNARHGFWRGAVGFARVLGAENGSQFFLLTSPRPELGEQGYTCFGWVVSGMDVVDRIERCDRLEEVRVLSKGNG